MGRATMLSLIACYSMYALYPLFAASLACCTKDGVVFKNFEKYRLRLWVFTLIVIVLAIDFALIPLLNNPIYGYRLYVSDTAVILVPLLFGALRKHTIWDLWIL